MTGDSMKQAMVTTEKRCQTSCRRKLNRNVNGSSDDRSDDDEENLSSYHHPGCAKTSTDANFTSELSSPLETDHIYAVDVKKEENEHSERLKEMMLLQLDLIQHQQEQILKKDKQLLSLKQEKESLKVRLDRMERRLSLLKHKKESSQSDTDDAVSTNSYSLNVVNSTSDEINSPSEKSFCSPAIVSRSYRRHGRGGFRGVRRRYFNRTHSMSIKKFIPSTTTASASNTSTELQCNLENSPDSISKIIGVRRRRGGGRKKESILRTEKLYFMSLGRTSSVQDEPPQDKNIEVPSWRYHPITSCYQMEGTEDIDDDVFYKRHVKLENDERRRKRWDIQRIREQRIHEKLRQKRQAVDKESNENRRHSRKYKINSFFPDPKEVQAIEVSDLVPVLAFGQTIPIFQSSEFSLPWFDPRESQEVTTVSKKNNTPDTTITKRTAT
ncbi:male-specific lethal 1-like 1 [Centruroides sculpturatus]|uniref:male-specific lethal 1-like 1 n=1 Tax=Centruroides sculpturatus TaxID=218467 RepID=UPI000C6CE84E|nr:male-specific lethal 1-like 1 [Centruroides sculpturatus]